MTSSPYQVRRATLDDLPALRPIWESMRLPAADLDKRITEFQVAIDPEGKVLGGVGFQMAERQGRIHSEAFSDFSVADPVRPLIWNRIQTLASNHGIVRLWTQEQAPLWKQHGFQPADAQALTKLPAAWNDPAATWLTVQLKNEEAIASVEKELAMMMDAERQRTAATLERVQAFKKMATLFAIVLALLVIGAAIYLFKKHPEVLMPGK